ncbi:MAG: glycosyltransferase [Bacteroidetes bacterium]|nr:glycosyltransferase [Bacteroidota bacterium]
MKVLILCYDFPPLISIGGQRPYSWLNYLPDSGIAVTIVTRHWQEAMNTPEDYVKPTAVEVSVETDLLKNKVIRVPFKPNLRDRLLLTFGFNQLVWLRKILSLLYTFLEYLMFWFDSKSEIYVAAEKQILANKPDFIIATGEPFILFRYAHLLSKKYKIKWVADYRDGWTTNQGHYQLSLLQKIRNLFFRTLEKKYLQGVSFITTAAPSYAQELQKLFATTDVRVVYNGFDEKHFQNTAAMERSAKKFIITYAGTIYPHQNLEMFLDGVLLFVDKENVQKNIFEVHFYGLLGQPNSVSRLINYKPELLPWLVPLPKISYSQMVKKMCESNLLLLLSSKGADWLNAKVFDYLAAKQKILLVENDEGVLQKLLQETNGGFAANNAEDVADFLKQEFENFKHARITFAETNDNYKKYSRGTQAKIFADLLKTNLLSN